MFVLRVVKAHGHRVAGAEIAVGYDEAQQLIAAGLAVRAGDPDPVAPKAAAHVAKAQEALEGMADILAPPPPPPLKTEPVKHEPAKQHDQPKHKGK